MQKLFVLAKVDRYSFLTLLTSHKNKRFFLQMGMVTTRKQNEHTDLDSHAY